MNTVKRQLSAIGIMLGGWFGSFGDHEPKRFQAGEQMEWRRSGQKGSKTKRPNKQSQRARSGHGRKMHRRSYLSGKPGLR